MKEISDIDAAYLAGFVDGEGCIAVNRQRNSHCRRGFAYRCGLRVANSDEAIMRWLVEITELGCISSHIPAMRNSKRQWSWDIWGDNAVSVVLRVRPFLRIRTKQADLLLVFQKALRSRKAFHLTDKELAFREDCYHRSRALNQRGAKPYIRPEIAKQYGGGGHARAAGFRIAFDDLVPGMR